MVWLWAKGLCFSSSREDSHVPEGGGGFLCACLSVWRFEVQGKVSVMLVLHLRAICTQDWNNFQHTELTSWIPKGVSFVKLVNKRGTREILAVNNGETSRARQRGKKSYIVLSISCAFSYIDHRNGTLPWKRQCLIPQAAYSQLSSRVAEYTDWLSAA